MKAEITFIVNSVFSEKQELTQPVPCNINNPQPETEAVNDNSLNEEELNQRVNLQLRFMNHFIGQSLNESQKEVLKANLKAFASDDKPTLLPVTTAKIGNYVVYDILHLCHAIGHHTLRSKTIYEIAKFAKSCFPTVFANWEVETMARKLTYTEYNNISIRVYKKSEPLPFFN